MVQLIEFNDWEFRAFDATGRLVYDQPASATANNGALTFGAEARAVARTHPQQYSSHYFHRLNADPLPAPLGDARNNADLIYHHLKSIGISGPTVVSIPGHISNSQLGLLLGIAKEAGIDVTGFVDTALAYALDVEFAGEAHVLDIEQHRASLTEIRAEDDARYVVECKALDPLGALGVIDGWLNVIADEFVQKTRFDPLHSAATEQQLLDVVVAWLVTDRMESKNVVVMTGDQSRDIDVSSEQLEEKLLQRLDAIDLNRVQRLVLTPRVSRVPGLRGLLERRVEQVFDASEERYYDCASRLAASLSADRVERISRGQSLVSIEAPAADAKPVADAATHLLLGAIATPIGAAQFARYLDANGKTLNGVVVNDRPLTGGSIKAGDRVGLGGATYTAIKVE